MSYRDYEYYTNERFRETVIYGLTKVFIESNDKDFIMLFGTCSETLNIYAPHKKTYTRGNHSPLMNKLQRKKMRLLGKTRLLWKFKSSKLQITELLREQISLFFPINPLQMEKCC